MEGSRDQSKRSWGCRSRRRKRRRKEIRREKIAEKTKKKRKEVKDNRVSNEELLVARSTKRYKKIYG